MEAGEVGAWPLMGWKRNGLIRTRSEKGSEEGALQFQFEQKNRLKKRKRERERGERERTRGIHVTVIQGHPDGRSKITDTETDHSRLRGEETILSLVCVAM